MGSKILALGFLAAMSAASHGLLFTATVRSIDGVGFDKNLLLGTIPGLAGHQVQITKVGIGGDADANSGKQVFQAIGGGVDFTWAAGQNQDPSFTIDHLLAPTNPTTGTNGRSFTYSAPNIFDVAATGQDVEIRWRGTADWDGRYTDDTDALGNIYNDAPLFASARAWVEYEYSTVPEPATVAIVLVGLGGLLRRRLARAI